ncbi:MAG: CDP-alcohol phosphatidyltransferase family protein [Pseudomonadales bacterium]|nr:CDP-alcohol phosphatidyltransferase family protein [Pseudomonadales bacterium]
MIDNYFRALLPRYVVPLVKLLAWLRLTPNQITLIGLIIALIAAYLVSQGELLLALIVWWLSRLLDALDGIYARAYDLSSDFGGFLDIQFDMAAYSAMVLAFYWRFPEYGLQWLVMLYCYVLCISGALGLGSFEAKKGIEDRSQRRMRIAVGLAEGGETGLAYSVFLLWPQYLGVTTWVWISILAVTILSRLVLARMELGGD